MKCTFLGYPCELRFARYQSTKNIAVELIVHNPDGSFPDAFHGEPVCAATTNIDPVPDDRIVVKDWSENVGMVQTLVEVGLIEDLPCGYKASGFVTAPVHMLTPAGVAEIRQAGVL